MTIGGVEAAAYDELRHLVEQIPADLLNRPKADPLAPQHVEAAPSEVAGTELKEAERGQANPVEKEVVPAVSAT